MEPSSLEAVLRCPNCAGDLLDSGEGRLDCAGCELPYPVLLDIPILVPSPHEWMAAYRDPVLAVLAERGASRAEIEMAMAFAEVGRGVEPRRFTDDWVASEIAGAPEPPVAGPVLAELDELLERIEDCSLEATLETAVPQPAELAVDLGCGAGSLTRRLAARAATTVAVDLSLRAVAHAVAGSGGEILGVVADIDAAILPLGDGVADLVLAAHLFDVVEDATGVVLKAARLLGAGGTLIASTPDPNLGLPEMPGDVPLLDGAALAAGFEITGVRDGVPWIRRHGRRHLELYLTRGVVARLASE